MNQKNAMDWKKRAETLQVRNQAFINGRFVPACSGKTFACIDPATRQIVAEIAECDAADVEIAVASARRAFESGHWSRMAPAERKRRLVRLGDLIADNLEELALLETIDVGKPITDSLTVDIPMTVECIRWYGEAIDKIYDEVAPTSPTAFAMLRRAPLGVVGAVVPWNFPLLMAAWKIGPVLATGNSMILKPAEQSPLTALRFAELVAEADIPSGVFNVLPGFGETVGRAIGLHMDIDAVTFTGSTEVGRYFMGYSGQSNLKRISLECGGKTPNIILADAPDLDAAATAAAWGIFYNQGQVCNAGSRLLIESSVKDQVVEKLTEVARTIRVGDTLDPATQMGPLIDNSQMQRVLDYIAVGQREGAMLHLGGQAQAESPGYFVEPTIFDGVDNGMTIAKEEIFGPVLSIIEVNNFDHAVTIANDSPYGLAAAVWTSDVNTVFKASDQLNAGVVWVNCFDHGDITTPFGGFKQSGSGRDKSLHAMDKYTDIKTTWISLQ